MHKEYYISLSIVKKVVSVKKNDL